MQRHIRHQQLRSRVPMVLPETVTALFYDWLKRSSLASVVALHANHATGFDHATGQTCDDMRAADAALLNQGVLLHRLPSHLLPPLVRRVVDETSKTPVLPLRLD